MASLDGFIADENDDVGPLFEWYFNGDTPIVEDAQGEAHGPFRISRRSHEYVSAMWGSIGATIQGRHLFDLTNGWEADPPAGEHLVVVSHRPKPEGWHPEADVPFVDDVTAAVEEAKQRAGDRVVALCAGNVGGQALALGLVDEVAIDVVPVVFGKGKRLLRPGRLADPARGPLRRHPGRPGPPPALPRPPLRGQDRNRRCRSA
ncbi:dihydrofolate reductase family protein [Nocardioides ungokensis]|uniref:dihydrofolate reductase family protein n=1 Tax=Nocardioides ungokensis TaxID=1643322 RepID=UPI001FE36368|nr:dihydrofolate reductase family protein [Nocardioides ungokensis]